MHRRYSITLLVITILFLSFILLPQDSNNIQQLAEQENVKIETSLIEKTHYHPSYEFHDRISIYDNDDFSEQGWPGAGTLENPYLIEDLEIVSDLDCIHVSGTTAYFIIRNCLVRAAAPSEHRDGIRIQSASNGIVEDCIIEKKGDGLYVLLSSNIILRNNTVRDTPDRGIHVSSSSSCEVIENTVYNIPNIGIYGSSLTNCKIANNSVWDSESSGVALFSSVDCTVFNNSIHDCDSNGIYFSTCTSTIFSNNTIYSNSGPGFYNYDSDQCDLTNNEVFDNEGEGIFGNRGDECKFEGNQIHDNTLEGVSIYYALLCNLTDNSFVNDGLSVIGATSSDWNHTLSGNTVNGKSLGYFFNESNLVIDGNNYGQIIIANCSKIAVQGGGILNSDIGIACYFSSQVTIDSVVIVHESIGIYLYVSSNCSVTNSVLSECGVTIVGSQLENWIHNFTGTSVNGLPILNCYNETGTVIDGSMYGQAVIVNSTNIQLNDGSFVNASQGIALAFSSDCTIARNTVAGGFNGMRIRACIDSNFVNNSIDNSLDRSVLVYYSEGCTFTNNTITNGEFGMYIYQSEHCIINESTISQNYYGIYASRSSHLNFSGNLEESNYRGIYFYLTSYSIIRNENVHANDYYGMYMYQSNYVVIEDCVVENNGNNGIYFSGSHNGSIIHNEVNQNGYDGISIWTSIDFEIINNTASENTNYGILLHHFCENNTIYGNTIVDNIYGNGYDYESENTWDDGISVGNFWSDYMGPGLYYLDGPGNNVDNYPTGPGVILIIHDDIIYHLDAASASLTWDSFAPEPQYFIVYREGEIHDSGIWDGLDVTTIIITDTLGIFNYTLFVNATSGENKTDTVMVTIYDNVPTINSPSDQGYNFDTTDHSIIWHPSDLNPFGYYVYKNSNLNKSGIWDGSSIEISINGLSVGTHNFILVVNDTSGNSVNDTVQVTIWDTEPFLDSPYGDITYVEGSPDQVIYWNASDFNPAYYTVYRNSSLFSSSLWNGEPISYQVHGLAVGVYNYTLKVNDTSGQTAYDTVIVTVTEAATITTTTTTTTTPTTTTTTANSTDIPLDPLITLAIGVGSVVVIVIVAIFVIRKRS